MCFIDCFMLGLLIRQSFRFATLKSLPRSNTGFFRMQEKKLVAEIKKTAKTGNDVSKFLPKCS